MAKLSFIETLLSIVLLCFCACTDSIVMNPVEKIVYVNSILTNDSVQTVNLSYSSYVSESFYPKVQEATVRMSFNIDTIVETKGSGDKWVETIIDTSGYYPFEKIEDGVWQAKFNPIGLAKYTLEIDIPDYGLLTASTIYPPDVLLYNATGRMMLNTKSSVEIALSSQEILISDYTDENIAYGVKPTIRGQDINLWIYGQDYDPDTKSYNIADYINASHLGTDNFNRTGVSKNNIKEFERPTSTEKSELLLEDTSIPGCYMFSWSYDYDQNGIGGVWHNGNNYYFNDRYLRIVQPYASIVSYEYFYKPERREPDDEFIISVNFKPYKYYVPHPLSHLVFQSMSVELDKYYKDIVVYIGSKSDLTSIYALEPVYSNINNGRGIFGATHNYKAAWGVSQHYYESFIASQKHL